MPQMGSEADTGVILDVPAMSLKVVELQQASAPSAWQGDYQRSAIRTTKQTLAAYDYALRLFLGLVRTTVVTAKATKAVAI